MSDLPEKIRHHYQSQSLPDDRVAAILAAGQLAAEHVPATPVPRPSRIYLLFVALGLAAAACLALVLFLRPAHPVGHYTQAALQAEVARFFDSPDCQVQLSHSDIVILRSWLFAQGAPADLEIPAPLQSLTGFGAHILSVNDRPSFMLCLWLHPPIGPMMKKPMMAPPNPSASTPLEPPAQATPAPTFVHLIISPRSDLIDAQPLDQPPHAAAQGRWAFLHWSRGALAYTLAATAPAAELHPLFSDRKKLTATQFITRHAKAWPTSPNLVAHYGHWLQPHDEKMPDWRFFSSWLNCQNQKIPEDRCYVSLIVNLSSVP